MTFLLKLDMLGFKSADDGKCTMLEQQLIAARKDVVTDGYDMSVGEISSLYAKRELVINPEYQRYFRWDIGRKTRFIESVLLSIPIPPIFVFQTDDGAWELVDGLQRVSTLLEFMGELLDADGKTVEASVLEGTRHLPALSGITWSGPKALTPPQKLDIKRARMRVEILKRESDPSSKFELFQRLNTGGQSLTDQEVRSCTIVMINAEFNRWLIHLSEHPSFVQCIGLSESATKKQEQIELALRFLSFRRCQYPLGMDVHEYLDRSAIEMASDKSYPKIKEARVFRETFDIIAEAFGTRAFRRWDGEKFSGKFLISVFEVLAVGAAHNLSALKALKPSKRAQFLSDKASGLWNNKEFKNNSGAGVRGSARLAHLLPLGKKALAP